MTHLKIKLSGTDLDWDVGRTIEVDRIATASGQARPWSFSLDLNEACPNEDYVIDFIERIDRLSRMLSNVCSTSSSRPRAISNRVATSPCIE